MSSSILYLLFGGLVLFAGKSRNILCVLCFSKIDSNSFKLSPNEDFSRNGIISHNKKVVNIAKLLLDHNVSVCVSKISPFVENRKDARKVLTNYNFLEVYVKCSIDSCEKRDVRGMYKKARNGEISNFIGIHVTYEPPANPELIVDTENFTINYSVQKILDYLGKNKLIKNTKEL